MPLYVLNVGLGIIEAVLDIYGYAQEKKSVNFDKSQGKCYFILHD